MWKALCDLWHTIFFRNGPEPQPSIASESKSSRELAVKKIVDQVLPDEPYVYQGRFSWFVLDADDEPRAMSFFFLDMALCIQVHGANVAPPLSRNEEFAITSSSLDQSAADFLRQICKTHGYGLLEIYPDAKITQEQIERYLAQMNFI